MRKSFLLPAILVSSFIAAAPVAGPATAAEPVTQAAAAAVKVGDPVSEAQFAWLLFVYAVQPANGSLMFETWTEQCQLNPSMLGCPPPSATATAGKARNFHGSALLEALRKKRGVRAAAAVVQPGIECNSMQTTKLNGYPPPSNLSSTAQFCEEVFVNSSERDFIEQNGLKTLSGQQTYGAAHGNAVTFPWNSIEVKADWVPASSFVAPSFSCPDKNLYTETINGTCYALVGLHISSKAKPDWVWATFEPASSITNPNRCDPKLYNTCFDPWGTTSKVPYGKGKTVPQSQPLQKLMADFKLNPAFGNYYLTGVQTQFVDARRKPIPLGSSFVEFNAGVNPGQASCITCHKYAYFDGKKPAPGNPEDNFGGAPNGWANIGYACNTKNPKGNCTPVAPNSTSQDFSWILGLMPF